MFGLVQGMTGLDNSGLETAYFKDVPITSFFDYSVRTSFQEWASRKQLSSFGFLTIFSSTLSGVIRVSEVCMLSKMLGRYSYISAVIAAGTLLLGPTVGAVNAQSLRPGTPATAIANRPATTQANSYQTLYVNPSVGSDSADGMEAQPLRTVTRALEVAPPNTVIVLAPGRYNQNSGEVFPLQLKPGVTIQGTPGSNDRTAIIEGGGSFNSPTRSRQNAAIIAADRAGIAQVAISNPDGYGVWIESASPTILESAFVGNRQTGIYVAGGSPRVQGSYFSGNQVAGLIVFGSSSANIQSNIFDGTGDAIRVLEGATPEIVGNRITNNEAGVVLVGDARPVIRDNQVAGNRNNDVVEVAARNRRAVTPAEETAAIAQSETAKAPDPVPQTPASAPAPARPIEVVPAPAQPSTSQVALRPAAAPATSVSSEDFESNASSSNASSIEREVAAIDDDGQIPAGAPGSALQALQSGIALGPRAVTGENPDTPRLIRNRRPERRQPERTSDPEHRSPVNNNRLAVPNSSIPLGSGGSSTVFSPPNGGAGAPPAPPSRAQALGLYYRVFVEASDPFMQDSVREVIPDAFRTRFEGRTVMQVGAFPTEDEAEARRRILEDNNFNVRVEYIR